MLRVLPFLAAAGCAAESPSQPVASAGACGFVELDDAANDDALEPTGLAVGDDALTICGHIDARAAVDGLVDVDRFGFTLPDNAGDLEIRLNAPGAGALDRVTLEVWHPLRPESSTVIGDHAVALVDGLLLPPDAVPAVRVVARDGVGPDEALPYTVTIATVAPDEECRDADQVLDGSEPASLFFETGADTTEVRLRLHWTDDAADLDLYLFDPPVGGDPLAGSALRRLRADELVASAVSPATSYRVAVLGGAPVPYAISICER